MILQSLDVFLFASFSSLYRSSLSSSSSSLLDGSHLDSIFGLFALFYIKTEERRKTGSVQDVLMFLSILFAFLWFFTSAHNEIRSPAAIVG